MIQTTVYGFRLVDGGYLQWIERRHTRGHVEYGIWSTRRSCWVQRLGTLSLLRQEIQSQLIIAGLMLTEEGRDLWVGEVGAPMR